MDDKERLYQIFRRAEVVQRPDLPSRGEPCIKNGFAGIVSKDRSYAFIDSCGDYPLSSLEQIAHVVFDDVIVIFGEQRLPTVLGDRITRLVISGDSTNVKMSHVEQHAICVVRRSAVCFIDYKPLMDSGVLIFRRDFIQAVMYGPEFTG